LKLFGISEGLDKNRKYNCINEKEIYNKNADIMYRKVSSPVKEWDYGAYKELRNNEVVGDKLEHDHIPSLNAIIKYLEERDNLKLARKKGIGEYVTNNATSLEVKETIHKKSRTYKGKNKLLSLEDSKDLRLATIKDFSYYLKDYKDINQKMVTRFVNVYVRNKYLCLYERI